MGYTLLTQALTPLSAIWSTCCTHSSQPYQTYEYECVQTWGQREDGGAPVTKALHEFIGEPLTTPISEPQHEIAHS